MSGDLLDRILSPHPPVFALVHRPGSGTPGTLDILVGDVTEHASLADIPLTGPRHGGSAPEVLVVIPYRQIAERAFAAPDDGAPLIAVTVSEHAVLPLAEVLERIPDTPTPVVGGRFDAEDDEYADTVRRVVADEIGSGEGANFVIKRSFVGDIAGYSPLSALALFRRLLTREQGAYWTFAINTGRDLLVGATPERHVTLAGGTAVMNPISGTYRYPATGPTVEGVIGFLADGKEADELYMVLDEELKMMARICEGGGRVVGPYLKEMTRLAHTEYFIEGRTQRDVREILHETLLAPTVTGSPVESAARVIQKYEPEGRGYYSGVAALIGRDANGERTLDSAILIRTADIEPNGRLRIPVGATLVRHSDPQAEAAETRAKAAGLLSALETAEDSRFARHPEVVSALRRRNDGLADFWLRRGVPDGPYGGDLDGISALVVDAEDTFTAMLALQLRSLGLAVNVRRFDAAYDLNAYDLVVLGPGPGDPRVTTHPKIARLAAAVEAALAARTPLVAVCLSHQVLSLRLGLSLIRRDTPNQGVRREIDLFGAREQVGFYNTFAAYCAEDKFEVEGVGMVEVSRDADTREVHALRGPRFASMQFHAESVLTVDGPRIIAEAVRRALKQEEPDR